VRGAVISTTGQYQYGAVALVGKGGQEKIVVIVILGTIFQFCDFQMQIFAFVGTHRGEIYWTGSYFRFYKNAAVKKECVRFKSDRPDQPFL
jgi:hypothetical protein